MTVADTVPGSDVARAAGRWTGTDEQRADNRPMNRDQCRRSVRIQICSSTAAGRSVGTLSSDQYTSSR